MLTRALSRAPSVAARGRRVTPARLLPDARTVLHLTMAPVERLRLAHATRTMSRAKIEHALTRFDCRTAGASVEADRQMILGHIAAKFATTADARLSFSSAAAAPGAEVAERATAYDNFNTRVRLAIREAVASFSHVGVSGSFEIDAAL